MSNYNFEKADEFQGDLALFLREINDFSSPVFSDIKMTVDLRDSVQDTGLATSSLLSIFTEARAFEEDILRDNSNDKRGWVGDEILNDYFGQPLVLGSRLWLVIERALMNDKTIDDANSEIKVSHQWMIDFKIAKEIIVDVQRYDNQTMNFTVKIVRIGQKEVLFKYFYNWVNQLIRVEQV